MRISDRLKANKNLFTPRATGFQNYGSGGYSGRNGRIGPGLNRATFTASLFTRIAIDASSTDILHVKIDEKTQNQTRIDSELQQCFNTQANIDQDNIEFIHDMVYSILDEGAIAVVPTDWEEDAEKFDIINMRTARIEQWYPRHVQISVYNESTGMNQSVVVEKEKVAIIENPLYEVVNAPNSTLNRLMKKIAIQDNSDDFAGSGKIDLIFQFKQAIKTEDQRALAQERVNSMTNQINSNGYGITWVDGTEDFKQLNRTVSNTLPDQIKELTIQFFNELGVTMNILNGTANEAEMRGYYTRTVDPILSRITAEFRRKYISRERRDKGETLIAYRDPFKLVPVSQVAEIADKFKRNAILSANEIRAVVGRGPDPSPESDKLYNPNIAEKNQMPGSTTPPEYDQNGGIIVEEEV